MAILVVGPTALLASSCGGGRVICDYAAPADTVTGRLARVHGSVATFVIETVEPSSSPSPFQSPPVLSKGDRIAVDYSFGQTKFLHVGSRYRVTVWWNAGTFASGVQGAGRCSTGTVYADGSAINTSWWRQVWLRGVLAVLAVGVICAVFVARRRESKRRRRERAALGRS